MKTIRKPKGKPAPVQVTCKNRDCAAIMECELRELKRHSDPRDGDAYSMTCPHCKHETWTDARLMEL